MHVDDPIVAAAQIAAAWRIPAEVRLEVSWDVPLSGDSPVAAVAVAANALREAGASPWPRLVFSTPAPLIENVASLATELSTAAEVARAVGEDATFTVAWQPQGSSTQALDARAYAFLVKRSAAAINGAVAGARVASQGLPANPEFLRTFYAEETAAYVDRVVLAPSVDEATLATLYELDPGKPVALDSTPLPDPSQRAALAAAESAARGIGIVLFSAPATADLAPLKALAMDFSGELSQDPSSMPASARGVAFVRGEDLGLRVVAEQPTGPAAWSLRFADRGIRKITRLDPATGREIGVGGKRFEGPDGTGVEVNLAGLGPVVSLRLERVSAADLDEIEGVKDTVDVTSEREIPVEEILRRLQAFEDAQGRRLRTLEARNTTSLRFGAGGTSIDATFRGPYFQRGGEPADWAWEEFLINGVKWRSKTLPEVPLLQPEKAAAMPLEILFTREYRYSLRGRATIDGRDCWVIDFEPLGAVEGKRLYQGTVWVDRAISARVRARAVQLGLQGDVLSNEETFYYQPVDANGQATDWSAATASAFVVPLRTVSQQLLSLLNASVVVEKETLLETVRFNADGFEDRRAAVFASDVTMLRETDKGLRYLVKDESGERQVKEGYDTNKAFLVGGVFYDDSLDYPLPLAGINYFNLDFRDREQQFNAFFAGALGTLSWSDPNVGGSRFDAGANSFFFAIPAEDEVFRDDEELPEESVTSQVIRAGFELGHPIGLFTKLNAGVGFEYRHYGDADDTAADFAIPSDNLTTSLGLDAKFARSGYEVRFGGAMHQRSEWETWGFAGNPEYDPSAKDYSTWRVALAKVWHLQRFRKFGVEFAYVGGQDLDRFSKYEFGFFGDTRVHGYQSDRVRAEEALAAHLRYGFEIGQVFRLEGIVDAAWATDDFSGLERELLAGVGVQGAFLGPWQTIVNIDVGVPVAGPEDGFAVYIAFLKLFQ